MNATSRLSLYRMKLKYHGTLKPRVAVLPCMVCILLYTTLKKKIILLMIDEHKLVVNRKKLKFRDTYYYTFIPNMYMYPGEDCYYIKGIGQMHKFKGCLNF